MTTHLTPERFAQEEDRLPPRRTLVITGGVIATIVLSSLVAAALLRWTLGGLDVEHGVARARPATTPREISGIEQTVIDVDRGGLKLLRAQQERLESYGWVDRRAGIAHIPIERAFDLYLEGKR